MTNRGFTLLELLLAALILSILGTLDWGAIAATFKSEQTINERTELQEIGTATILKIREDLSQTFIVEAAHSLTFFKGEDKMDRDKLSFTSLSHRRLRPQARETDQTEVTYEVDSDPGHPNLYQLKRRESRYIDDKPDEGGDFATLATQVLSFELEYSDGNSFRPTWDTRSSDNMNKLPKLIHVTLKLRDQREREEIFETFVDIPMSESLGQTVAVQGNPNQVPPTPFPPHPPAPRPTP